MIWRWLTALVVDRDYRKWEQVKEREAAMHRANREAKERKNLELRERWLYGRELRACKDPYEVQLGVDGYLHPEKGPVRYLAGDVQHAIKALGIPQTTEEADRVFRVAAEMAVYRMELLSKIAPNHEQPPGSLGGIGVQSQLNVGHEHSNLTNRWYRKR
jgi:hypothetical protein